MDESLAQRRRRLEAARSGAVGTDGVVAPDVVASWQRSATFVDAGLPSAPTAPDDEVEAAWSESRIRIAGATIIDELAAVADAEDYVAAITDAEGTILWCHGGRSMRRLGEGVNFVRGGRWGEQHAGTNALGLALVSGRPASVFSGEHWADAVADWVCYSAPVLDPETGRPLGVIDLSSTWERTSGLGLTTVTALARLVTAELARPETHRPVEWQLRLLGRPQLLHHGAEVRLTTRQVEILAVLALEGGLSLDSLHAHVYGDRDVSASTLKAEVSHLRKVLGGGLASRPYRLTVPLVTDVDRLLAALDRHDLDEALRWYGGPMMPATDSPLLVGCGYHVAAALQRAIDGYGTAEHRLAYQRRHLAELLDD